MHFRAAELVLKLLAPHSSYTVNLFEALSHIVEPITDSITQQECLFGLSLVLLLAEVSNRIQSVALNFLKNFNFGLFCLRVDLTHTQHKISSPFIVLLN